MERQANSSISPQPSETRRSFSRVLRINTNESHPNIERVFKALASDRRLAILHYLSTHMCSVHEIAEALDMPPSTVTMHLNVLEEAGLVRTELKPASRGLQKVCMRVFDQIAIDLPSDSAHDSNVFDAAMPVGSFVDCEVSPTCGMASEQALIGQVDDPASFYDPGRLNAQLIWFRQGFLEYRFPNWLLANAHPHSLQFSMEIASEAPLHNLDWPSDITLWVNDVEIGTWTSPADYGGERGILTPMWWEEWNSQHGVLKTWRIAEDGAYIDGLRISNITLADLALNRHRYIAMRVGIKEDAENIGGLNLFGRAFGNYPQDIIMRMRYSILPRSQLNGG